MAVNDLIGLDYFNEERRKHYHTTGVCFLRGAPVNPHPPLLGTGVGEEEERDDIMPDEADMDGELCSRIIIYICQYFSLDVFCASILGTVEEIDNNSSDDTGSCFTSDNPTIIVLYSNWPGTPPQQREIQQPPPQPCKCKGRYGARCQACWESVDIHGIRQQTADLPTGERGVMIRNELEKGIFWDHHMKAFNFVMKVADFRVCFKTWLSIIGLPVSTTYRAMRATKKRATAARAADLVTVAPRILGHADRIARMDSIGTKNAIAWLDCYGEAVGEKMPMVERATGTLLSLALARVHSHYTYLLVYYLGEMQPVSAPAPARAPAAPAVVRRRHNYPQRHAMCMCCTTIIKLLFLTVMCVAVVRVYAPPADDDVEIRLPQVRKEDVFLEFSMYCKNNNEECTSKAHFLKLWKKHCHHIKWHEYCA